MKVFFFLNLAFLMSINLLIHFLLHEKALCFQHVWWPAPACGHEWPLFPTTRAGVEIYRKHPPSGREWLLFPSGREWPLVSGGRKWSLFHFSMSTPKATPRESSFLFARALNIFKTRFRRVPRIRIPGLMAQKRELKIGEEFTLSQKLVSFQSQKFQTKTSTPLNGTQKVSSY